MRETAAVILAAGEGTRMKSDLPKVLHEVLFKPMINWVEDAVRKAGISGLCVVAGPQGECIEKRLHGEHTLVSQTQRLGTGHAVMQAAEFIRSRGGDVLILNGDAPLITPDAMRGALEAHRREGNAVTVITAQAENPFGYGRVERAPNGNIVRIIEEKDATPEQKQIREINSGAFWFRSEALLEALPEIKNDNAKREYYLTDAVEIIGEKGLKSGTFPADISVVAAANDRVQLLELNETARKLVLRRLMLGGVTVVNDSGVIVGPDVTVGRDTTLLPGTMIRGNTVVGSGCVIGPNSFISDCVFGNNISFNSSQADSSKVEDGATIGPYAHLRPNSLLHENVHAGNFVEVKNSEVGIGTKISHLTYVGDSDVGSKVNFGCGCVTVNYDGVTKHRCTVEDHAFIGCNTNLVAPVKVGRNAYTAAGSTITRDVPEDALAVARSRQENKEGWVLRRRKKNQ